jgi:hypothetical protein
MSPTRTAPALTTAHRRNVRDLDRLTTNDNRTLAAIVSAPAFSLAKLMLTREDVS